MGYGCTKKRGKAWWNDGHPNQFPLWAMVSCWVFWYWSCMLVSYRLLVMSCFHISFLPTQNHIFPMLYAYQVTCKLKIELFYCLVKTLYKTSNCFHYLAYKMRRAVVLSNSKAKIKVKQLRWYSIIRLALVATENFLIRIECLPAGFLLSVQT